MLHHLRVNSAGFSIQIEINNGIRMDVQLMMLILVALPVMRIKEFQLIFVVVVTLNTHPFGQCDR